MCICVCTYFNHRADACRYEDKQAGLLVKQIEEDHNGAETSPQHCETKHNILHWNSSVQVTDTAVELFGPDFLLITFNPMHFSNVPTC